jgi:hypothetical protein
LRQTRSVEAFITEFQRKAVAVSDILEHRIVTLFIEALTEPLRGWVKAFKPHTLQEAIVRVAVLIHTWGNVEETFNPLGVSLGASLESRCCHLILNSSV